MDAKGLVATDSDFLATCSLYTSTVPCREVFARGQRAVQVEGAFGLPGTAEVHKGFGADAGLALTCKS